MKFNRILFILFILLGIVLIGEVVYFQYVTRTQAEREKKALFIQTTNQSNKEYKNLLNDPGVWNIDSRLQFARNAQ